MKVSTAATFGFFIVVFVAGLNSPARASCYSDCIGRCSMTGESSSYSCTSRSGYCSGKCLMEGGGNSKSYGAIAYSASSGSYGYSEKFGNRKQAEARARSECGKNDCQVGTWYFNSCGAVAAGANGSWGGAQNDSEQRARSLAQARCAKEGGRNCQVVLSKCSR